jgi:hypothetical protein
LTKVRYELYLDFLLLLKKFTQTKNTNKLASRQQAKEDTKNVKKTGSA